METTFIYTAPAARVSFTSGRSAISSPVGHLTEQHNSYLSSSQCVSVSARAKFAPRITGTRHALSRKSIASSTRHVSSQLKHSRPPPHAGLTIRPWGIRDSGNHNVVLGRRQRTQASTGNGALMAVESDVTTTTVEQIGLVNQDSLCTELPNTESDGRFAELLRVASDLSSKNESDRALPSQSQFCDELPVNGTSGNLPDSLPIGTSGPLATSPELPIGEAPYGESPGAPAVSFALLESPITFLPDTNVGGSTSKPSTSPLAERASPSKADVRAGRKDVWRPRATRKFSWREFRGTQHPVQRKKHSQNMVPPRVYGMAQEVGRMWAEQKEIQLDSWKPTGGELAEVLKELQKSKRSAAAVDAVFAYYRNTCQPHIYGFNKIIAAAARRGDATSALKYFQELQSVRLEADGYTYTALMDALARAGRLEEAVALLKERQVAGDEAVDGMFKVLLDNVMAQSPITVVNDLIATVEAGGLQLDVEAYEVLMHGFSRKKQYNLVEETFSLMQTLGLRPNTKCWSLAMEAKAVTGQKEGVREIWKQLEGGAGWAEEGVMKAAEGGVMPKPPHHLVVGLLVAWLKAGEVDEALSILDAFSRPQQQAVPYAYNLLVLELCRKKRVEEAEARLEEMKILKIDRSAGPYNALLGAYGRRREADKVEELFLEMKRREVPPDKATYSSLIQSCIYMKEGGRAKALKYYNAILEGGEHPDVVCYVVLVPALCANGDLNRALKILGDMKERGTRPPQAVYGTLVHYLLAAGRLGEGLGLMKEGGVLEEKAVEDLTRLANRLGRMGDIQDVLTAVRAASPSVYERLMAEVRKKRLEEEGKLGAVSTTDVQLGKEAYVLRKPLVRVGGGEEKEAKGEEVVEEGRGGEGDGARGKDDLLGQLGYEKVRSTGGARLWGGGEGSERDRGRQETLKVDGVMRRGLGGAESLGEKVGGEEAVLVGDGRPAKRKGKGAKAKEGGVAVKSAHRGDEQRGVERRKEGVEERVEWVMVGSSVKGPRVEREVEEEDEEREAGRREVEEERDGGGAGEGAAEAEVEGVAAMTLTSEEEEEIMADVLRVSRALTEEGWKKGAIPRPQKEEDQIEAYLAAFASVLEVHVTDGHMTQSQGQAIFDRLISRLAGQEGGGGWEGESVDVGEGQENVGVGEVEVQLEKEGVGLGLGEERVGGSYEQVGEEAQAAVAREERDAVGGGMEERGGEEEEGRVEERVADGSAWLVEEGLQSGDVAEGIEVILGPAEGKEKEEEKVEEKEEEEEEEEEKEEEKEAEAVSSEGGSSEGGGESAASEEYGSGEGVGLWETEEAWEDLQLTLGGGLQPDMDSWVQVLRGFGSGGEAARMREVLAAWADGMGGWGNLPLEAFNVAIEFAARGGEVGETEEWAEVMRRNGILPRKDTLRLLLRPDLALTPSPSVPLASLTPASVLQSLSDSAGATPPLCLEWTAQICCEAPILAPLVRFAVSLVKLMRKDGQEPSAVTCQALVDAHGQVADREGVRALVSEMGRDRWLHARSAYRATIGWELRLGGFREARGLLVDMRVAGLQLGGADFAPLIRAAAKLAGEGGGGWELRELLEEVEMENVKLDRGTYEALLSALLKSNDCPKAVSWFRRMMGALPAVPPPEAFTEELLEGLAGRRMWRPMMEIFATLIEMQGIKSMTSFFLVMDTLYKCNKAKLVVEVAPHISGAGLTPDARCLRVLNAAYQHLGMTWQQQKMAEALQLAEIKEAKETEILKVHIVPNGRRKQIDVEERGVAV